MAGTNATAWVNEYISKRALSRDTALTQEYEETGEVLQQNGAKGFKATLTFAGDPEKSVPAHTCSGVGLSKKQALKEASALLKAHILAISEMPPTKIRDDRVTTHTANAVQLVKEMVEQIMGPTQHRTWDALLGEVVQATLHNDGWVPLGQLAYFEPVLEFILHTAVSHTGRSRAGQIELGMQQLLQRIRSSLPAWDQALPFELDISFSSFRLPNFTIPESPEKLREAVLDEVCKKNVSAEDEETENNLTFTCVVIPPDGSPLREVELPVAGYYLSHIARELACYLPNGSAVATNQVADISKPFLMCYGKVGFSWQRLDLSKADVLVTDKAEGPHYWPADAGAAQEPSQTAGVTQLDEEELIQMMYNPGTLRKIDPTG